MSKKSIPAIKKRARNVFSKYIRLKHSKEGHCTCVTCGVVKPIDEIHAGHYIHNKLSTLFNESNVHPQCVSCNTFKHGNLAKYALWLEENYQHGILQELEVLSNQVHKITYEQYEEMIDEWNKLIKELEYTHW